uniref:SET domain containing 4 n=1 Tax=Naja naja TaxID=35670 RepID=A0A8C6VRW8_NAJNA
MKKGRGRTYRKRHRKRSAAFSSSNVNLSYKNEYIVLKKWLKEKGYKNNNLSPAVFSGNVLITFLEAEELIISLPEKCLLTSNTVLNSYLREYILKWRPPISPVIALCSFLIAEKWFHRKSVWKPYLDLLPETYTCPVYLEQETLNLFPEPLRRKALEQRSMIQDLFASSKQFFSSLQPLFPEDVEIIFNFSAFRWAWCTINTRTVFMKHSQKDFFSREPDIYALAPFLDLLNHNPKAQVKASFNENTKCYEIKTHLGYQKYKEVYISYGPHDNQRLLLEYGFVASDNPHSCVHVSTGKTLTRSIQNNKKLRTIFKNTFFPSDLTFGWDGPSWTLLTALKLLCLEADEFTLWKKVVLGDVASRKNEEKSVAFATKICMSLMEETQLVLQKVSVLKNHYEHLVNQLGLVEALHTENLRILQLSYKILQHLSSTTI